MTVPSFVYRWQASPDEHLPDGVEGVDWRRTEGGAFENLHLLPPTLRTARFAWALGSAPAAFDFPSFVSAWQPWKRPWDWERDGC